MRVCSGASSGRRRKAHDKQGLQGTPPNSEPALGALTILSAPRGACRISMILTPLSRTQRAGARPRRFPYERMDRRDARANEFLQHQLNTVFILTTANRHRRTRYKTETGLDPPAVLGTTRQECCGQRSNPCWRKVAEGRTQRIQYACVPVTAIRRTFWRQASPVAPGVAEGRGLVLLRWGDGEGRGAAQAQGPQPGVYDYCVRILAPACVLACLQACACVLAPLRHSWD